MRALEIAITLMADGKSFALKDTKAEDLGNTITLLYTDPENEEGMKLVQEAFADYQVIITVATENPGVDSFIQSWPSMKLPPLRSFEPLYDEEAFRQKLKDIVQPIMRDAVIEKIRHSTLDSPWRRKNKYHNYGRR